MPPLLDYLRAIRADMLWSMADPVTTKRAATLHASRYVQHIEWLTPNCLEAIVLTDKELRLRIQFKSDKPQFYCDCPASIASSRPCAHSLSVLMSSCLILNGTKFSAVPEEEPAYWEQLRRQLTSNDPAAPAAKKRPVLLLSKSSYGNSIEFKYLDSEDESPWKSFVVPQELRPFVMAMHSMSEVEAAFAGWMETGAAADYNILVLHAAKRHLIPHGPLVPLQRLATFDLKPDGVQIYESLSSLEFDSRKLEDAVRIGRDTFLLPSLGRIGRLEHDAIHTLLNELQYLLPGHAALSGQSTGAPRKIPHQQFNRLHLTIEEIHDTPGLRFLINGSPSELQEAPLISSFEIPELESEEQVALIPRLQARDHFLDHPQEMAEVLSPLGLSTDRGFASSRRRISALSDAAHRIFLAEDKSEVKSVLSNAAKHPNLSAHKHSIIAKRLLKGLVTQYLESARYEIQARPEDDAKPADWFVVKQPDLKAGRSLAIARFILGGELEDYDGGEFDYSHKCISVPPANFHSKLGEFAKACASEGIRLTHREEELATADIEVSISLEDSDKIDWFELKPEVRCDGFTIPEEKWESILRGGLFVDQSGKLRIVPAEVVEQIRQLMDTVGRHSRNREKGSPDDSGLRVPKLAILDFLELKKQGIECNVTSPEARALQSLAEFESMPSLPVPAGIRATLRQYQIDGYSWLGFLYNHRLGACLADDMGLGKTLQTITFLAALQEGIVPAMASRERTGPHLIVLPPTLLFNWASEIETFFPKLRVHQYSGANRYAKFDNIDVVLTTYELARRDMDVLADVPFHVIIFDEAQAIKNFDSARSQSMLELNGKFKICLTGTPLENHIGEYFSIVNLAIPGILGRRKEFMDAVRAGAEDALLRRAKPFVLRRTKAVILNELPPKVESNAFLDLNDAQREIYTRTVGEIRQEVLEAYGTKPAQQAGIIALSAIMRLRQVCVSPAILDPDHSEISPKIAYLIDQIQQLGEEGHAALVFSQFVRALDLVQAALNACAIPHLRMDGNTPVPSRKDLVSTFQKEDGPPVFLISLKTGGAGINLTRASYVFHLDPWWNPAVENQASDRAHRIGQQSHVFIKRLVMRHTIEEKIMQLKEQKQQLFDQVLSGSSKGKNSSPINKEDIEFLLGT